MAAVTTSTRRASRFLVHETGAEELARQVEAEFANLKDTELKLPDSDIQAIAAYFAPATLPNRPEGWGNLARWKKADPEFARWVHQNVQPHKHPDYGMVTISLKPIGGIPGGRQRRADGYCRRNRRGICVRRDPRQP